jgi:hypothetical protein
MLNSQSGNNLGPKKDIIYILPIVTKLTVRKWRSGSHCEHKQGLVLEIFSFKSQFVLDLSVFVYADPHPAAAEVGFERWAIAYDLSSYFYYIVCPLAYFSLFVCC